MLKGCVYKCFLLYVSCDLSFMPVFHFLLTRGRVRVRHVFTYIPKAIQCQSTWYFSFWCINVPFLCPTSVQTQISLDPNTYLATRSPQIFGHYFRGLFPLILVYPSSVSQHDNVSLHESHLSYSHDADACHSLLFMVEKCIFSCFSFFINGE